MAFSEKSQLCVVHKESETKSFLSILCFRHFRRKIYGFWNEENWQNILCTVIAALHLFSNPGCKPYTYLFWFSGLSVWQYGLWSFQTEDIELERFLPKSQHTRRKLWVLSFGLMASCQKVPKFYFQSQFSMSKIIRLFLIFFIEDYQSRSTFFLLTFFDKINF